MLARLKVLKKELRPPWLDASEAIPMDILITRDLRGRGEVLAEFISDKENFPAAVCTDTGIEFSFEPITALGNILFERYSKQRRPLYTFLPSISRRLIPGYLKKYIKKAELFLSSGNSDGLFPSWPIDKSIEILKHLLRMSGSAAHQDAIRQIVENTGPLKTPKFALTHDIDSAYGYKNLDAAMGIEKDMGIKATYFIVGSLMEKFPKETSSLSAGGHEIGLHGLHHDDKLSFYSASRIRGIFSKAKGIINDFNIKGFRSPMLFRSDALFDAIRDAFLYDSSVPDTGIFSPYARASGCCSIFPYYRKGVLEIPVTLPIDSSFVFSGIGCEDALELWKGKAAWIESMGGAAVLLTHLEPHFMNERRIQKSYKSFLRFMVDKTRFESVTLGELAVQISCAEGRLPCPI